MIIKIIRKSSVFIIVLIYLIGLILFGETHPFSKFPMYSSFENWAYAFYITDANDSLIPCLKLHTRGGNLGHSFYTICNKKHISYGDGLESKSDLNKIGLEMMQLVLNKPENIKMKNEKLKLWRIFFYYKNDSIIKLNQMIYEINME
jgi:hypothetical protein